ncbi:putative MFS transporter [Cercophora newfieldiana]|uniref:MFS transporter n=1 Tax=Cercophora newfieldiana TaxID=92897 RepID=A0AA39YAT1_9PEZI|nr:putative MFS transporter [Cercophora newfieldiana]
MTKTEENGVEDAESLPQLPQGDAGDGSTTIESTTALHGFRLYAVAIGLYFGALMMSLDISIIGTAIPSITTEFGDTSEIAWYPAAYTFAICAFTPIAGKLASTFPLNWVYLCFSTVFLVGSIVCATAPTSSALIVGRAVSGLGAGGVGSNGLTILVTIAPVKLKQMFMGVGAACFTIGLVISPVLGGIFTERLTWRWCFWINLPFIAVTIAVLSIFWKPPSASDPKIMIARARNLDLRGCVLFVGAIFMLLYALQTGGQHHWNMSIVIGLLVGSGLTTIVFAVWERRKGADALIPGSVAGRTTIVCTTLFAFFHLGSITIATYYLPEWFQAVQGVGPLESGVRLLPSVLTNVVAAVLASGVSRRLKYYNYWFFIAPVFLLISCALYTRFTAFSTPSGHWIGFQVIQGFAGGFGMQFSTLAAQLELKDSPELIPIGIALVMFVQYLGATILQTIAGVIFNRILREQLSVQAGLTETEIMLLLKGGIRSIREVTRHRFPEKLDLVLEAYNSAITAVFFVPVGAAILALAMAFGIKWNRIEGTEEEAAPDPQANIKAPET